MESKSTIGSTSMTTSSSKCRVCSSCQFYRHLAKDLNLSNNEQGVLFAYTTSSTIMNVIASDNYDGIYLWGSNSNIVIGSNITNSGWDGIGLYYSEHNTIAKHGNNR